LQAFQIFLFFSRTEAASLTPTSIRLLWEAPHPPMTTRAEKEQHFRYVVRGKPIGLEIEQEADNQEFFRVVELPLIFGPPMVPTQTFDMSL